MTRTAICALILSCVALPTEAARLITGAVPQPQDSFTECFLTYWGPSTANIPVVMTIKRDTATVSQTRTVVNKNKPFAQFGSSCSQGCRPLSCAFSFSAPASDFRASICVTQGGGPPFCLPAS